MLKQKFIKIILQQGESLNRVNFSHCKCMLVLSGCLVVFNVHGKCVFRLEAGDVNIFNAYREFTGTALKDDTVVVIV